MLACVTTLADAIFLVGPTRRLFINVGFLGAYTTFSSLALGDVLLFANGRWLPALLYIVTSIIGGVIAVILGDGLGTWCVQRFQRRSTTPAIATKEADHIDIEDDLLLPGETHKTSHL